MAVLGKVELQGVLGRASAVSRGQARAGEGAAANPQRDAVGG
jgi:hypothetical protein